MSTNPSHSELLRRERENVHTAEMFEAAYGTRDWRAYSGVLAEVVRYAPPGPMLDVGCGTGLLLECARAWGITATGLEASAHAVKICRDKGLDVAEGHISAGLPWPIDRFTVVVANQVAEHLPAEVARMLWREAGRVLRPGGVLLVTSPCRYNAQARREPSHINLYTPSRLEAEIRMAGFDVVSNWNEPRNFGLGAAGRTAARVLWRLLHWDILALSANCTARQRCRGADLPLESP